MKLTLAAGAALAIGGFFGARLVAPTRAAPRAPAPPNRPTEELRVPHLKGSITLDGDMDDKGWMGPVARTGGFHLPNGEAARPYSEARIVWGDGHLYLALYAADEDIRAERREPDGPVWLDDAFRMAFVSGDTEMAFDVNALGIVTDAKRVGAGAYDYAWQSGAHVSTEADGTPNAPNDDDEEWALEIAIPLESLGLEGKKGERIGFSVHRCDTPKNHPRVCASWGEGEAAGVLVLE